MPMADVFVSYARADRSRVEPLVRILEARGISVWWDPGILPGHEFHSLIEEQLACAKCVLVAWSKAAVLSTWVLGEAEEGRQRRILVPFLLDDCCAPIPFRPIHTADLRGWDGGIDYPALAQLLSGIDRCIA